MTVYSSTLLWLMLEDNTFSRKARDIDDALDYMYNNYGGYGKTHSLGNIAKFIGISKPRLRLIEKLALEKVEKLLKERSLSEHEYDHH